VSETIRRVSEHPMKASFDATPRDTALRSEDGWLDMDVRWLFTRETVGSERSAVRVRLAPLLGTPASPAGISACSGDEAVSPPLAGRNGG
jgi:hypothetical protein